LAAVWELQIAGVDPNDPAATMDPVFNPPSIVTAQAGSVGYEILRKSIPNLNVTGVEAGGEVMFKFSRLGGNVNDTLASVPAQLLALRFAIRRNT
jgi:hypothetical protein